MNYKFCTAIVKLMIWSSNGWARFHQELSSKNVMLRIHYDQLLLTSDTKILETFNMRNKMKGVYKGDILILIVSTADQQIRKIRFQIKTDVETCLSQLGTHFSILCHDNLQTKNTASTKFRQIEDVFKEALTLDQGPSTSLPIPPDYENFIKMCLLDPSFPCLVSETAKILKKDFS